MTTTILNVNGRRAETIAEPETPLLYVLRNDLGLKGTKFGCGAGTCGACTVHVDGRPEQSCILPISAVEGRQVTTIESLSSADGPDPLQRAFIDEQAGQCGYCLSGILMSARSLLDRNPNPARGEIRSALDGHICRCGAMDRMIRAVERAAGGELS
jgi:nicotinate dehydrogenase subunit A